MAVDNVTFLIMWFLVMFITLSSGILVIMYRVGCFKCDRKIGIGDLPTSLQKLIHPQQSQQPYPDQGVMEEQREIRSRGVALVEVGPLSIPSPTPGPARMLLQRQHTDRSGRSSGGTSGPNKVCTVCGEPLGPEEDTSDNSHPACRDMDASFL